MRRSIPRWLHDMYQQTEYIDERIRRKNEKYGYIEPERSCRVEVNRPLGDGWEDARQAFYRLSSARAYAEWAAIEQIETRVLDAKTGEVLWSSTEPEPDPKREAA